LAQEIPETFIPDPAGTEKKKRVTPSECNIERKRKLAAIHRQL
jgi:hypothetical protein